MISAIGIASHGQIDSEYLWIIQELRKLGLSPTGSKSTDKSRLEQAKSELITKIHQKEAQKTQQSIQVQPISPVQETDDAKRAEMEEQRLGAMTVAELNRIYFGI